MSVLLLARDVAAIFSVAAVAIAAIVLASGAFGLFGGLAASLATIAAAGIVSFALIGLASSFGAPSLGVIAVVLAALVLMGAFFGAHHYGVRGLWMSFLTALGVGLAVLLAAAATRAQAHSTSIAVGAPVLIFALLAISCFAALSAASRAAAERAEMANADSRTALALGAFSHARNMFAAPPFWFDCAYATLGGAAERPALCPFNPPRIKGVPVWASPLSPPGNADQTPDQAATREATAPEDAEAAPTALSFIAETNETTPRFEKADAAEGATPPVPTTADAPAQKDAITSESMSRESDSPPESPPAAKLPANLAKAPVEGAAPDGDVADEAYSPEAPRLVATADSPNPTFRETAPEPLRDHAPEREMSTFVCFPMLGAIAERLCPDQSLGHDDFELRWTEEGGEATAPPADIDCYFDSSLSLHMTLLVNLSGDLVGRMPRHARADASLLRKSEAIYEMATRLIVEVRADEGEDDRLFLSMYVANGSKLLSPWASQDFGPERSDRLFDVRSSGQTLALLRRLKNENKALRKSALGGDLAAALETALSERPEAPFGTGQQKMLVLVTDENAVALLKEAELDMLATRLQDANMPLFVLALDTDAPPEPLKRLAERSGGEGFGVRDAARLSEIVTKVVFRARSFCALKVTAPESLFRAGTLEVRLRRRLTDGCQFERVATLDCAGLQMSERIIPATR